MNLKEARIKLKQLKAKLGKEKIFLIEQEKLRYKGFENEFKIDFENSINEIIKEYDNKINNLGIYKVLVVENKYLEKLINNYIVGESQENYVEVNFKFTTEFFQIKNLKKII